MKVTYNIEVVVVIDDDDSAEDFRRELEDSIEREWIKFPEKGERISTSTKRIDL